MNKNRPASIEPSQLHYLYKSNLIRRLGLLARVCQDRLSHRNVKQGHLGLKPSFGTVLGNMALSGSRLVDIAEREGLSKQAVGQVANEIEALGYIKRVPDPLDGRAKNLAFTDKGYQLIEDSLAATRDIENDIEALLGRERFDTLRDILEELADKLETG